MSAYYNEHDKGAAAWLRELIKRGLIADGEVDGRSIVDVEPADIAGFTQCHFFAGIGGWSLALREAGWPDDKPVWTGSAPCQPFSSAGKQAGFDDERHLWPAFHWLISQCRPERIFGEQVASGPAMDWLDHVQTDLEGEGHACGAVVFPACGVGAPHLRQRMYWMAKSDSQRLDGQHALLRAEAAGREQAALSETTGGCKSGDSPGPTNGRWRDADWLGCTDGKWRCVEPGTQPLADGLPARVVRLRGYGNAINIAQAAAFVRAA